MLLICLQVVFGTPYDPSLELLIKLDCDFCVHGDDMSTTADGRDAYAEVKEAGRMKVVKRTEGVSTTDLVGRLLLMTRQHHIGTGTSSPALAPLVPASTSAAAAAAASGSSASSPSLVALSSKLMEATLAGAAGAGAAPPSLALEPSVSASVSVSPASPAVRKSSDVVAPRASPSSSAAASVRSPDKPASIADKPISNFLPTTWSATRSHSRARGGRERAAVAAREDSNERGACRLRRCVSCSVVHFFLSLICCCLSVSRRCRRITQFSNHKSPSPTDKIVYIDGAFDLFHVGHIETLRSAKALGTFLYVGIHDDPTVNLHKGSNYPIMNIYERVMNVLSCRFVDEVVIGAPWVVTQDLITTLNLHVVASGTNTKMDPTVEAAILVGAANAAAGAGVSGPRLSQQPYAVPKALGIFKEIETTSNLSTEDVVRRLIKNRDDYEKRNAKRAPKEATYNAQKQFIAEI